jgi:N-acetylmuramoyl-L-alanine amidase
LDLTQDNRVTMMLAMNPAACRVSISRTIMGTLFFAFILVIPASAGRWDSEGAALSFQKASQMRDEISRSGQAALSQYRNCAEAYRKVYFKDPHYVHAADAIYEEAIVYQEMGDRFSNHDFYKIAAKRFHLLVDGYGGSRNCPNALLRLYYLYSGPLKDERAAEKATQVLKTQYRISAEARNLPTRNIAANPAPKEPKKADIPKTANTSVSSLVQNIRHWSTTEYTRVTVDMDSDAKYSAASLSNPQRIYFDISHAKLSGDLQQRAISVDDRLLRQIRVAAKSSDIVRIVLDLVGESQYTITELRNPFRIVVDLHGPLSASVRLNKPDTKLNPPSGKSVSATASKINQASENKAHKSAGAIADRSELRANASTASTITAKTNNPPVAIAGMGTHRVDDVKLASVTLPASVVQAPPTTDSNNAKDPEDSFVKTGASKETSANALLDTKVLLPSIPASKNRTESMKADLSPQSPSNPASGSKTENRKKLAANRYPTSIPKAAPSTSYGDRTLTRMLGLKIGRIVIDPGHGGDDLGSVGPGGLLEKDLVLSLACDLQQLLQKRLGAEVFLTRYNDTFVSLEERTAIANQHRADIFISIHANSSRSRSTSGVETYYLDFAKTNAAREIASRENSTADSAIHELEDLIKKIAQADKSAESRELASIVQKSLYAGVRKLIPSTQNRGVRSAPFVVLIGANMPSILAEVAFLSNPRDEKILKRPASQERVVKALFFGIEGYIPFPFSLGGMCSCNRAGGIGFKQLFSGRS